MNRFVLDNSVVMAWYFEDEANDFTASILESLASSEALVPTIWPLEVANVLLVGERRGRSTEARTSRFIALLDALPIRVDAATSQHALAGILTLAREQRLSAYDAAYLELAMREGVSLATQDQALRRAAEACGVGLLGVSGAF
ncbi:MAG: type II toxin-antitoxin system VapC family toxin [Methylacidiphilales bacterium]|nr:type II toxin-antitoxin system VapC family toxin [Candidatus Methylacidiphilales bacterium]